MTNNRQLNAHHRKVDCRQSLVVIKLIL